MYLNKVAFSEMIWRKTINLLPDLVQFKDKRGRCVSAKYQKCWKNESTWVFQKRSCVKNTLIMRRFWFIPEIFRSPSNLISYQISCYQNQPPICFHNAKKDFSVFLKLILNNNFKK